MPRRILLIVVAAAVVVGCKRKDGVTFVKEDDPKMNAAMDQARATVGTFTAALKAPKNGQDGFAFKMAFRQGKHVEHMWVGEVRFDGRTLSGIVNNDPVQVKNVKSGDPASIDVSQISDWMYVDNNKLVGGYTIRVLRDGMSAKERREFDRSVPFKFD